MDAENKKDEKINKIMMCIFMNLVKYETIGYFKNCRYMYTFACLYVRLKWKIYILHSPVVDYLICRLDNYVCARGHMEMKMFSSDHQGNEYTEEIAKEVVLEVFLDWFD